MDFGDMQGFHSGRKAEKAGSKAAKAAKAARKAVRKVARDNAKISGILEKQVADADAQRHTEELEKHRSSQLFHLTKKLEVDLGVLVNEPNENIAKEIAGGYIRSPTDDYLDANNYTALEYKELAEKNKIIYLQLTNNDWFQWGASVVHAEIAEENQLRKEELEKKRKIQAKEEFDCRRLDEESRLRQEVEAVREKRKEWFSYIALISVGAGGFFTYMAFSDIELQYKPFLKFMYIAFGAPCLLAGLAFGVAAYKNWK